MLREFTEVYNVSLSSREQTFSRNITLCIILLHHHPYFFISWPPFIEHFIHTGLGSQHVLLP
jgi:hypothetical protein